MADRGDGIEAGTDPAPPAPALRDAKTGRFRPGVSGNPAGRPNPSPSLDAIRLATPILALSAICLDASADAGLRGDASVQLLRLLAHCSDAVLTALLELWPGSTGLGGRLDQVDQ